MPARPFILCRRPTTRKDRYVYYAQFRDEAGKRSSAVSTGQTSRAAAESWANQWLKNGKIPS
jgi:hypothetical protein